MQGVELAIVASVCIEIESGLRTNQERDLKTISRSQKTIVTWEILVRTQLVFCLFVFIFVFFFSVFVVAIVIVCFYFFMAMQFLLCYALFSFVSPCFLSIAAKVVKIIGEKRKNLIFLSSHSGLLNNKLNEPMVPGAQHLSGFLDLVPGYVPKTPFLSGTFCF